MISASKKTYQKPTLSKVGSFENVTQGGVVGSKLDATFPSGTSFSDLTFS